VKKGGAGSAVALGYLDAHHTQVEKPAKQVRRDLCVLVHLADERPDFAVGELVNAVAKERFVLAELSKSYRKAVSLLHASNSLTGLS
jgi:hypothetical protein